MHLKLAIKIFFSYPTQFVRNSGDKKVIKKEWKKLSLACLGILLATASQANTREGIYAGAGIGASFDQFNLSTKNTVTGFTIKSPVQKNTSALGNVFLGYGGTMDTGFFLGGEVGTYFPRRSATIYNRPGVSVTSLTFNDTLKVHDYVTADILPGYRFNDDWLLYARGGLTYANLNIYQAPGTSGVTFRADENKFGGRIGAGINYAFNDNLGVGLDYFYTRYQEMNANLPAFNIRFNQQVSGNYVGLSALYTIM
ncbi:MULTISPECIES: outer membrane protein [Legionella]|uniref:outer membrane protein n=1 Tax=Legionella TaxID=445 RepID=UPI001315735C|nr:outer membrane beta-barrel protein [Legionella septentrionalis]MCP0913420.1 porin family protein [Legionella sp. 27cVA30]